VLRNTWAAIRSAVHVVASTGRGSWSGGVVSEPAISAATNAR
jgi:hypothetical protein